PHRGADAQFALGLLLDAAASSVGHGQQQPQGELRISAPVWCATPRFASLLADYRRAYPQVRLDLHLDNHMVDIVSDGFDVALRMTAEPAPQLIARPLCQMAFHWVAVPGLVHDLEHGADQAGEPQPIPVILPNYVQLDRMKDRLQEGMRRRIDPVMKSSDTTLSYHAMAAGIGAAFMPAWLVDDDLAAGRLVRLPVDTGFMSTLYAVYASRRQMPLKVRSFIDFLAQRLGELLAASGKMEKGTAIATV
ncbi:MAG: LysR family transcriptional regulator, partial [Comamonadaceae bacterium]